MLDTQADPRTFSFFERSKNGKGKKIRGYGKKPSAKHSDLNSGTKGRVYHVRYVRPRKLN